MAASLGTTSITTNSIRAVVSGLQSDYAYSRTIGWYIGTSRSQQSFSGYTYTDPTRRETESSYTFRKLNSSTKYYITCNIDTQNQNVFSETITATTKAPPPPPKPGNAGSVRVNSITATTITISYPRVDNATSYEVMIRFSNDTIGESLVTFKTDSLTYTFERLSPGTSYTMNYRGINSSGKGATGTGATATTKLNRPASWTGWNSVSQGRNFNITAEQWINFCNRINEFRRYKEISPYSFTTSSQYIAKGKPFYAWIFRQAANAISEIPGQGGVAQACKDVNANDTIYAWYFQNLSTSLNDIS